MSESLVIGSSAITGQLELGSLIRYGKAEERDSFIARLAVGGLTASIRVSTAWTAYEKESLVDFFEEIASHWTGWEGDKIWKARDGEMEIACAHIDRENVELLVTLTGETRGTPWLARGPVHVPASQLEYVCTGIRRFLGL